MKDIFTSLVTNMSYPLCVVDLDLKFIFVNKMYSKITGKKEEELLGQSKEVVFDKPTCEKLNSGYREAQKTETIISLRIQIGDSYENCTIIPIKSSEGKVTALVGIVGIERDFTKIKEQQKEFEMNKNLTKAITDILPGAVFCKNAEGQYIYANRECEEFYKEKGIDTIIGKTDSEINPNVEQVRKFMSDDKFVLESGEVCFSEAVFESEDGRKTYRETIKTPLFDSYGNISGIIGRALDVTERKIYEDNLKYISYTDVLTQAKNRTYFEHIDRKFTSEGRFPIGIIMGDSNGLKLVNDTFGHSEGDNLLIATADAMKKASEGIGEVFRFGGDEFAILIPNATMELCDEVIEAINRECANFKNQYFNISVSLGAALKEDETVDIYTALKTAEDKVYRQKLIKGNSFKKSVIDSLKVSLSVKSEEKEEHNKNVAENALKLAKKLNFSIAQCDELKISSELHDIGVIGVSEEILNKKGNLDSYEYEEVKTHCEKGYRIVRALSHLKDVADNILYHHERWDGKGYPIGLKGEEIPIISRIISICDTFDVITNYRVYREGKMTIEEGLEEIKRCSGTQFDPYLVEEFISIFEEEKAEEMYSFEKILE